MPKLPHCPRLIVAGPDFVTASTASAARAGVAEISDSTQVNSRIPIQL